MSKKFIALYSGLVIWIGQIVSRGVEFVLCFLKKEWKIMKLSEFIEILDEVIAENSAFIQSIPTLDIDSSFCDDLEQLRDLFFATLPGNLPGRARCEFSQSLNGESDEGLRLALTEAFLLWCFGAKGEEIMKPLEYIIDENSCDCDSDQEWEEVWKSFTGWKEGNEEI